MSRLAWVENEAAQGSGGRERREERAREKGGRSPLARRENGARDYLTGKGKRGAAAKGGAKSA